MSGGEDGLKAGQEALNTVAKGINGAIGELKGLGSAGEAAVGRGFSELALSGLESGHEGLTSAFKDFCDRWEWGVRALIHDGSEFAKRVGLAAGYYHEGDQYVKDTLKVTVNAAMGNPHLTEQQVEGKSLREVLADNPYTQVRDADYSAESFRHTGENARQVWSRTGEDLKDSLTTGGPTPMGVAIRAGRKIEGDG